MEKRIIKFRAWTNRDKCWVGAFAVHMSGLWRESPNNEWTDLSKQDEIILMQYTGLKDKNGKEIYEGDILKLPSRYDGDTRYKEHIAQVYWDEDGWYVAQKGECNWNEMVIIGNIYENPNLLSHE